MIRLPDYPGPSSAVPSLIDYGVTLRPSTGGAVQKVSRAGSRYRVELTFPPMLPDDARVFISRLIEAKRTGLIAVRFPLLGINQGAPGSPVVDGAGQAGTSLNIRNVRPGHTFFEGFWISIFDATGQMYLHNVRANAVVGGDGKATLKIDPPLRYPFANGATIEAAKPELQGFIDGGEYSWSIAAASIVGLSVTIEEAR